MDYSRVLVVVFQNLISVSRYNFILFIQFQHFFIDFKKIFRKTNFFIGHAQYAQN